MYWFTQNRLLIMLQYKRKYMQYCSPVHLNIFKTILTRYSQTIRSLGAYDDMFTIKEGKSMRIIPFCPAVT